jgi:uncharacterized membrane protein YdjX (TVP38/TMEM64 family)
MNRWTSRATRRYVLLVAGIAALTLVGFLVAELLDVTPLQAPGGYLDTGGVPAALFGLGLLLADVAVPVPASLIMISFGALYGFGPALFLSWAGGTGATMVGFWIGRHGGRAVRPPKRVERLLGRWGVLAVGMTRPVPILAETVAIVAGTSRQLSAGHTWAAAAVGSLPAAIVYSAAGAFATDAVSGLLVVPLVVLLTTALWIAGRRWLRATPETGPCVRGRADGHHTRVDG